MTTPFTFEVKVWDLDPAAFSSDEHDRTPGLHVSQITHDLNRLVAGEVKHRTDTRMTDYTNLGFLFEDLFTEVLRAKIHNEAFIIKPGEVAFNGEESIYVDDWLKQHPEETTVLPGFVIGTPDGVSVEDDGEIVLEEWKATTKQSRKAIVPGTWVREHRWYWEMNTKFYMLAMGLRRVRFRLLFLDVEKYVIVPRYMTWLSEPVSHEDLWQNWIMLRDHARSKGWMP